MKFLNRNRRRESSRRDDSGLSLLELMIVLVIIGLVASIAVPQLISYLDRAKVDTAKVQVRNLNTIVDLFRMDVGRVPTDAEGLDALVRQPAGVDAWNGPYLRSAPSLMDPWGHPYVYRSIDNGRAVEITSLGADGQEGGEGLNADITE